MDFGSMLMPDSPVDSLSCVCAMVLAAEDFDVPHNDILKFITAQLAAKPRNGDLKVMAARTVSALLEQCQRGGSMRAIMTQMFRGGHAPPAPAQSRINWAPALKAVFDSVSGSQNGFVFSNQHTMADLQESVLGVLAAALTSKSDSVRSSLPSDEEQLSMFEAMTGDTQLGTAPDMLALAQLMDPLLPMAMKQTPGSAVTERICSLVLEIVSKVVCSATPQRMNFEWDRLVIKCINFIGLVALKHSVTRPPTQKKGVKRQRGQTEGPMGQLRQITFAFLEVLASLSLDLVSHQRVELLLNAVCSLLSYLPDITISSPEIKPKDSAKLCDLGLGFLDRVVRTASTEGGLKLFQANPFEAADFHFFDAIFGDMIEDTHAHDNIFSVPTAKGVPIALTFVAWTMEIPLDMVATPRRTWHWKNVGDESLQSYPPKDSLFISKGLQSGAPKVSIGRQYEIDFEKMVQRNVKTSTERPIAYSAIPTNWDPVIPTSTAPRPARASSSSSPTAPNKVQNPFEVATMEAMFPRKLLHRGIFDHNAPLKQALFRRLSSLVVNPSIIRISTTPTTSAGSQALTTQQKAELQHMEDSFAVIAMQLLGALSLDSKDLFNSELQHFLTIVRNTANAEVAGATVHYLHNHPSFDTAKGYGLITSSGMLDLLQSRLRTLKNKAQSTPPPKKAPKARKGAPPSPSIFADDATIKSLEQLIADVTQGHGAGLNTTSLTSHNSDVEALLVSVGDATSTKNLKGLVQWLTETSPVLIVSSLKSLVTADPVALKDTAVLSGLAAVLSITSVLEETLKRRIANAVLECFTQLVAALSQKDAERHDALGPWSRDIQTCFRIMASNVRAEVASSKQGAPRACPTCAGPLRIHHSVTWRCNECRAHTENASFACRKCDYDICFQCALQKFGGTYCVDPSSYVRAVTKQSMQAKGFVHGSMTLVNGRYAAGSELIMSALGRADPSAHDAWDPLSDENLPVAVPKGRKKQTKAAEQTTHSGRLETYATLAEASASAIRVEAPTEVSRALPKVLVTAVRSAVRVLGSGSDAVAGTSEGICKMIAKVFSDNAAQMMCKGNSGIPAWCRELFELGTDLFPVSFLRECCWYAGVHLHRCAEAMSDQGGRTVLKKAVVPRGDGLLPQMASIMSSGDTSQMLRLDYQFQDEAGTGTGPAQEVYAETSAALAKDATLWRDPTTTSNLLFPRKEPLSDKVVSGSKRARSGEGESESATTTVSEVARFSLLGFVSARAFVDNLLVDVALHPAFWVLVKGIDPATQTAPLSFLMEALSLLDPVAYRSISTIASSTDSELTAFDLVLRDDVTPVTRSNVDAYCVEELTYELVGRGAIQAALAVRLAFDWIIPVDTFSLVSAATMDELLCGSRRPGVGEKYFSEDELRCVIKGDHGYHSASVELARLAKIVGSFTADDQIAFIEFLTGSSRLPPGGLAGLGRPITVVKKDMEGQVSKEQTLPSCNTCFLYFKLPSYSTEEIMRERLLVAVREGKRGFALS